MDGTSANNLYGTMLGFHSWMRWITLVLGLCATINAYADPRTPSTKPPGSRWDTFFMAAVDLQVLLGLILYFGLSPFTKIAMLDLGAALKDPALRFWGVTHILMMFGASGLVRAGRVLAASAKSPEARRTRRTVCFTLAILTMIAAIPWPGLAHGRPFFRL